VRAELGAQMCLDGGYNELKTRAAAPASPTMNRLLWSDPAPLLVPLAV